MTPAGAPHPPPLVGGGQGGGGPPPLPPLTVEERLFLEAFAFDFFQAVRLLEKVQRSARAIGRGGPPGEEAVRLRVHQALDFPASALHHLERLTDPPVPALTVTFLGLTGPSGVLPRHYTELLMRLQRDARGPERTALRSWLDLFNHRLLSLFYRAWEKYRFYIPYERGEYERRDPDPFTRCLFSLVGLGTPVLRNRLRVAAPLDDTFDALRESPRIVDGVGGRERVLARLDDLALLRYSGFFAHQPRCAVSLEAMLSSYLKLPVQVQQFQGQWLRLEPTSQSALGEPTPGAAMGVNVVVGERVWDVQARVRIRLGPLSYERFVEFLPDRSPVPERKLIFLVAQLVRLYVGLEVDVDIQLILRAEDVPATKLGRPTLGMGSRLGWNTWSRSRPMRRDAADAVFQVADGVWLHVPPVP
ncbi:MAG: type VI secretion system baseplate subunit TssG [Gemmataceae bacterium]|nr:type VI secretion system baseplate subunit TssG [Gemmataceae bacterium]